MWLTGAIAVVAYAWWATGVEPFTTTATLAVVGVGAIAVATGQAFRRRTAGRPEPSRILPWLLVLAGLAAWQLAAYVQEPRSEHPTLSSLANSVLDTHTARTIAFAGWLVGGFALARR